MSSATVTPGDESVRFCGELLAGMADLGLTKAFISPGSRNTPLVIAAMAEPRIDTVNIRDERSAGFMALGWGKITGTPAAVICTSGSAATHYFPAVVEADQSGAPLVVLTSDRPVRLRGTGAPQTMDQHGLYGDHVVLSVDGETVDDPRATGRLAIGTALGSLVEAPGPVHVNLPFDEPLVPTQTHPVPSPAPRDHWLGDLEPAGIFDGLEGSRVMVVASGRTTPGFADALDRFAQTVGAPILADPQALVTGPNVIHRADLHVGVIDRDGTRFVLDSLRPDVVVRLGPLPTSKPLWEWMQTSGVPQIHIERTRLRDPLGSATQTVVADPTAVLAAESAPSNPDAYVERWRALDAVAGAAMESAMGALPFPNEPEISRIVADSAPSDAALWVASSRPIRDVDAYGMRRHDRAVFANRGVNGIDGTVSSALGAAASGRPTLLVAGDIAVLHDATALAEAAQLGSPLRIVAVNNDGGGIFEFLPQASSGIIGRTGFEQHWGTPHGLSLSAISRAFGLQAWNVSTREDLRAAVSAPISGPELIELSTDRTDLVAHHTAIRRQVAEALGRSDQLEEGS